MTDWYRIVKLITGLETQAEQRGDDRASAELREIGEAVFSAQSILLKEEDRRRRDRARKEKRSVESTESAESTESVEKGGFPPHPLSSKKLPTTTQHSAREAGEMVEILTASLSGVMAQFWPEADAFLKRRPFATWEGWLREMASLVGPGSQFVPADLAQACRDDAALSRPIASPKGLRAFLGSARAERLNPPTPFPQRRGSTAAQRTAANGAEALKDIA